MIITLHEEWERQTETHVTLRSQYQRIAHKSDSRLGDGSRIITAETEGEGERRLVVN
jgi:hypothetical protein